MCTIQEVLGREAPGLYSALHILYLRSSHSAVILAHRRTAADADRSRRDKKCKITDTDTRLWDWTNRLFSVSKYERLLVTLY